ncbi:MAG: hypothetical protein WAM14_26920 [Candidatus Nitrosopolaris sp.]
MIASVVLVSGFIFIMPLNNTDGKAFAQTSTPANNQSATSKSNSTATGTKATSFVALNFSRAVGTIASIQSNETGKPLSFYYR